MTTILNHRKILDDVFNAYTIMAHGSYVLLLDVKSKVIRYCPELVEAFGLRDEYLPDGEVNWSDFIHPQERFGFKHTMRALLNGEIKAYDRYYRTRLKDGTYAKLRYIGSIVRDEDGSPALIGGILINEGLTESIDSVTLLRNHYGFFRDLVAALELNRSCVVMLCGINKMSDINEEHGYPFGNAVLQQTGWLLQEIFGNDGTVYRMAGAKFAFLSDTLSPEEVEAKYEKVRRAAQAGIAVENVRQVLSINGGMIYLDRTISNERTIYTSLLFAYNDSKFYHNGSLVNYNGPLGINMHDSLELLDEVRDCILMDCKNFSLRYQPIFDIKTNKLTSVEALLCWHSERFGDVPPSAYVPVLEHDYLFEELGYWIMRRAMEEVVKVLEFKPDLILNINIAPAQIIDDFLFNEIRKSSKATNFPLTNLCFELTQSCRLIEPNILKNIVNELKSRNILCLIDDFGSGVASIDFLRDLAPDFIKLERDYIMNINTKTGNLQIVRHLSELAAELGTKVCLKGVGDEKIRDTVKDLPITNVQGNFYSEAVSLDEIIKRYI
ncbi:MAG: EAL domain-containing protein [Selenomonadaceae bacterium]|nr:EAL domain-containing protein [Selenomonadaceae bacterium]